jgi:hypothetical protein
MKMDDVSEGTAYSAFAATPQESSPKGERRLKAWGYCRNLRYCPTKSQPTLFE